MLIYKTNSLKFIFESNIRVHEYLFITARADISCYVCSSDTSTGAFCNDPFDVNAIPPESKRWAYAQCSRPSEHILQTGGRTVCQKVRDRGK